MVDRCDFVVKIPMQFCVNVSVAAAIVMYDRLQSMGRFQRRPERPGGPIDTLPKPHFGEPKFKAKAEEFITRPPSDVHPKEDE